MLFIHADVGGSMGVTFRPRRGRHAATCAWLPMLQRKGRTATSRRDAPPTYRPLAPKGELPKADSVDTVRPAVARTESARRSHIVPVVRRDRARAERRRRRRMARVPADDRG